MSIYAEMPDNEFFQMYFLLKLFLEKKHFFGLHYRSKAPPILFEFKLWNFLHAYMQNFWDLKGFSEMQRLEAGSIEFSKKRGPNKTYQIYLCHNFEVWADLYMQ